MKALLQYPAPERDAKLLAELPSPMPGNPALAAVLTEAMAKEFMRGEAMNKNANFPKSVAAVEVVAGVLICPFRTFRGKRLDQICGRGHSRT